MSINFEVGKLKEGRKENEYPFDTIQVLMTAEKALELRNHLNSELDKRIDNPVFVLVGAQLK